MTSVPGTGAHIAFALASRASRIHLEAYDLDRSGAPVGQWESGIVGPSRGQRELRLASWSPDGPDLFVIDRGLPDRAMRVRVLSRASRFRRVLLDRRVYVGAGFPRADWSLDIGRIAGDRPDLMLVSRSPITGSHSTEVHVLTAKSEYSQYYMEAASTLPASLGGRRNLVGFLNGLPTWFSINAVGARVQPFTLLG